MKRYIIGSSIGLFVLILLIGREILIHREIENLQTEIRSSYRQSIEKAESFERIEKLIGASVVYQRTLDPIIQNAQRLLSPFGRADLIANWEREIAQMLEDVVYSKTTALRSNVQDQIGKLREKSSASIQRLREIALLAKDMGSSDEQMAVVEAELSAIQKDAQDQDQKLIDRIKQEGILHLKELQEMIRDKKEAELSDYLASKAFYLQVQKPVLDLILDLKQSELRKSTLEQFATTLYKVLNRQAVSLASARDEESATSASNSISNILKREFEREKESEVHVPTPATSPSDAGRPKVEQLPYE